ncbi:Protein N-acetyltransferase, RimJ/RimL family [Brevibacterium siliguriense]|uniref:Protein N-acetyltransferase, RimJ/RimL family n=1 Tax=Brevibacterium siliguriense TaxID=1136497 RepID=A0A1H1SBP0_9MICO|nr:GNAT family protein [Brevibacterium siliguriense]SDS45351.1 Protein N-acetyltransferase, RimJ/RimL family [Brevibacterium siliguriense]
MSAILRPWKSGDAEALAGVYERADDALLSNIPDDRTIVGAQTWITSITDAEAAGDLCARAIVHDGDRSEQRILGKVMASGIERRHSSAWISYWAVAEARGHGLVSAALRSFVDFLHDELGIYRLELGYRVNNPASAAVARNAGFIIEGREREKLLYDGVRYDTEVCARLSGDPRHPGLRMPIAAPH